MSASNGELFEDLTVPVVVSAPMESPKASARVLRPSRDQLKLHPCNLESLRAEDHPAWLVWGYVERQDLRPLYSAILVVEGGSGRSAIAPEICSVCPR